MLRSLILASAILIAAPPVSHAQSLAAPPDASCYIIWPRDGATIKGGKFWLRMGLKGMGIAPAGIEVANTGHHHAIVDVPLPPLDEPIPADKNHLHFGGGQTEVRMELPPGKHTLQLILGDAKHQPFNPPVVSKQITITVVE